MRNKSFDDYSSAHLKMLRAILTELFAALGGIAKDLYLVGGLVPDLLVNSKLQYIKELVKYKGNKDVVDAFRAIQRHFRDESSIGTKDVVDILVRRYGLERAFANKEVVYPIAYLK